MLNQMGWGFFLLIPAAILFFGEVSGIAALRQQRAKAQSDWKSSLESWNRVAGFGRFDEKKEALQKAAESYRALPAVEKEMLKSLELRKRELQLQKYLESHKLSNAVIDSIGDGRKMTLRSFGFESAWDITSNNVLSVPGFGQTLTKKLTEWRRKIEARFKFNPNIATDPADIAKVRAEIAMRRNSLESLLLHGARELETIRSDALAKRNSRIEYENIYKVMRQAEGDAAVF
jgi:DNA-binding helix-hairpin-helix protein with protein kinase domain